MNTPVITLDEGWQKLKTQGVLKIQEVRQAAPPVLRPSRPPTLRAAARHACACARSPEEPPCGALISTGRAAGARADPRGPDRQRLSH
jgi:hypothetical protein